LIEQLQATAKSLAVAYEALWRTLRIAEDKRTATDWNFIVVWADMVRTKQAALGIELMTPPSLDNYIRKGREMVLKLEALERENLEEERRKAQQNEDIEITPLNPASNDTAF